MNYDGSCRTDCLKKDAGEENKMSMDSETVRLGIIGIGNMGSEHCRNIQGGKCPDVRITAVADLREDRRRWASERLPGAAVYCSGEELISAGNCDAVLIAVPHFGHEALAISAMEKGLDVLCEKPAAVTASAARRMLKTAERTGRCLTYMFNQRTNCTYRAIHDALGSGTFGELKRVNWIVTDWYRTQRYYDSGTWRATWSGEGGGVLLNQCPHQLDLLIWLCGMPKKVRAVCHEGKWHRIEVEDDVSAYFEFEGGATGVMITSTGDLPGTNRLEIDCEKGKIVCEDGIARCWKLSESERSICFESDNPWYHADASMTVMKTDGINLQHVGVINAFADHILNGRPPVATAADGLNAIMLSNAIHMAGWTGEEITTPLNEERFDRMLEERIARSQPKNGYDQTYETSHERTGETINPSSDHTS